MELGTVEKLLHATVRIETSAADGSMGWGTGFFFSFETSHGAKVCVVTNKHVVDEAAEISFNLTERDAEGRPRLGRHIDHHLLEFKDRFLGHPDPDVDLCVIPFGHVLQASESQGQFFYSTHLDKSHLLSEQDLAAILPLEDVLMIGYPNSLWDSHNNMPILRRGITATHIALDYEGAKEFVIDAAVFPGSSGSPVFLYNNGHWASRQGSHFGTERAKLAGILYAAPFMTEEGELQVVEIPTHKRAFVARKQMINLGYVIKAERISEMLPVIEQALTAKHPSFHM